MNIKIFILILLTTAFICSCSLAKGKPIAESAVAQFHNQFNNEQFHEIYAQSDSKFQESTSEEQLNEFLSAVHRKIGTVKTANQAGWHVNATTMGTVVDLQYDTEFTEGKAGEEFEFIVSGEQAKLVHYNINSPLLITR